MKITSAKVDTAKIDTQIEQAKARLSALYAKRREIIAASKPRRVSAADRKQRDQQIVAMARGGASMEAIVAKVKLSKGFIKYCLWQAIADELANGKTGKYSEREFELKKRLYPGIKWRLGGNYGNYRGRVEWPVDWRTVRYRFNDGTVDPDPADDDGDRPGWETAWKKQKPA